MTQLSLLTVNYNSAEKTIKMVNSLVEQDFDLRVEVLDNASVEEDFCRLKMALGGLPCDQGLFALDRGN
jgi:GT2 family glycosyltransferase